MSLTTTPDDTSEFRDLEEKASPFPALYAHWERTQWSALALDLNTDAASFAALGPEERRGMIWIFAHRFHAEFNVARLLAPFLLAAPEFELQLLFATQVADEYRHVQAVLRVYEEVIGVKGGIEAVQQLADRNSDPVADSLYALLEHYVGRLSTRASEDVLLAAVVAYHLLAEGVVARTSQNLAVGQYERLGAFPGLIEGQRLVARDEARHIGIGVSYARRRVMAEPERASAVVWEVIDRFAKVTADLLETAKRSMGELVEAGYGVSPELFYDEAMRLMRLRLRSIGVSNNDG
jgi:ribonucleotide reductase beta subunit family protein with ferritin-like domain